MLTTPIQKSIELVGGQVALAKAICTWHLQHGNEVRVAQGHVWNWLNTAKTPMPPAEHCRAIEEATGGQVTRYDLRPDVFGECPCDVFGQNTNPTDGLPVDPLSQEAA